MTDDLHHLAAAYALNAIDPDERVDFEAHYRACDVCVADVAAFKDVAAWLAKATEQSPPPSLFASVIDQVQRTEQVDDRPRHATAHVGQSAAVRTASDDTNWRNIAVIAAAIAVFAVGTFIAQTVFAASPVEQLATPDDAISSRLSATVDGQSGEIEIWWSPARDKIAVLAIDLPDLHDDEVYALWFLIDDGVAPAALLRPHNGTIEAMFDVNDLDANGWGITIEPANGSRLPTTEVIFAATT